MKRSFACASCPMWEPTPETAKNLVTGNPMETMATATIGECRAKFPEGPREIRGSVVTTRWPLTSRDEWCAQHPDFAG